MAQFRDNIEMKVIIQGTEAINELGKLEAEAKDLRLSLKDIAKENEGFKQLEVAAKNLDKQYAKLDETLKTHTNTQTISKNKVDELTTKIQELEQAEVKDEKQIKELNKQREFHNRLLTNSTENIETTNLRLAANAAEMKKVQSELKTTAKFTQEYIDANAKIAGAEQKIKELREEYGLTAMTMQQLRKYQGELNRELDNVTFGTQAYKDLKIKIQEVSNTILSQKNDVKTVTQDFKVLVATVGLAGMTIEQLGDYQKELNQELKGVVFGTDAYKNLKNKIQDVNNAIENQQADLKTTTKYFKELISIVGISGLNIEQLADYQKELNQELNGVVFGTQAYKDLKNKIQEVNGVIENQKADLKASTQDFKALRAAVGLAGMTIEQLGDYQKQLNQELNGVVFGTAAYKDLKNRIQEVSGVIKNQQNDLQDTRTSWQKFKDEMRAFGTATMGNIGGEIAMRAFDGMTQALVGTVTQAAKLSDELADIQRFTGLSAEETKKLNSELSALNTRTGTGDLREITMIGGQLGVAKEEILGFVTSIDKANVALSKEFGGSAEAVANALGKIKNLFAETKNMKFGEAMERIGSALTAAGASSSASAPQISDFAQRLGAIGELGPKLTESLGLGTALLDLGLSSEIAASGLQALFITAGKESESFAAQMGISVEEFKKLQNNDPNKMLIDLAKSFKGLDNDEVLAGLLRMKITSGETVKVMALLKDNTEKVSAAQTLMANEFANNTKLQDAFNAKMSTFGAQVDLAKKEINGLVAGLTSALLPAMTKIVEKTVAFVIILKELPKFLDENKYVIGALTVALITLNFQMIAAQANALRMSFNMLVLRSTLGSVAIAQGALNVILSLNPIGAVITAVALLVAGLAYLYNSNEDVRKSVDALWGAYKFFIQTYLEFYKKIFSLDFTGALDTLIAAFQTAWKEIKKTVLQDENFDLMKPFEGIIKTFEELKNSFNSFFDSISNFQTAASTSFSNIANTLKNQFALVISYVLETNNKIENEWQNLVAPVKKGLAEVGEGFRRYGQMYVDFGKQIYNSDFSETLSKSITEVGKGFVAYKNLFVSAYNDIVNYDYAQYTDKIKAKFTSIVISVQKNLSEVGEGFRRYGQMYVDFGKQIYNSSFSENLSKSITELGKGFKAYAKIFTDFYQDVKNVYLNLQNQAIEYLTNLFDKLKNTVTEFIQANFGQDIQRIYTAWEGVKNSVNSVKIAFENLTQSIQNTFAAITDNAISKAMNKFTELVDWSSTQLDENVSNNKKEPLLSKQQQQQNKKDAGGLLYSFEPEKTKPANQSKKPEISAEDAALIAANKKRAADAALADKAENDKKDAAAAERYKKLKEDRLKAEKDANEAIAALKLELLKDEEQKEIAQAKLANAKSLEKYQELFDKKMISKQQFDEIEKLQQETLNQKLFEIDNKWRAKTAEEILAANKKTFDEKLKNLESDKSLDDAQAGLNNVNAAADVADKFKETPELQDAALADLEYAQKQAALDRESEFLNQKLELYRENGMLTTDLENGFKAEQTAISAQKMELELSNAKRISTEKEALRKKESADIKQGLTQIGSAAGSIASSLEQLGIKNSAFGKALALTQIAISTGTALAESIPLAIKAASMTGPGGAFVFAGTLATITATILGSIAQAKSVIEAAPTPTASAKGAESGASGGGNSGYFDGGTQREGAGYTGGSSIYEPITFIGHGGEYIIPNWMMRQAPIANFAGILEGIRTNKTNVNSLYSQNQGNKTYFDGGFMTNTNSQNIDNQQNTMNLQLMQMINTLSEKVANVNAQPAKVVLRDISEANLQEQILEQDVKI